MTKIFFVFTVVLFPHFSFAQNRISEHNTIGWFTTTITPAISKKLSLHAEYQWRRENVVKDWQQSLLRVGVNYKIHPQVTLHAGYGWIETFPYGTYTLATVPKRFPEHRVYEQMVVTANVGKSSLLQRLRLEQRWLGRYASMNTVRPSYVFLNRLRYMPRLDIPLGEKLVYGFLQRNIHWFWKKRRRKCF
ncbi:MAG TPA: DUF2490 domain-containing protein [Segetibacter sp.]|nr:DUF2490 domain-containing protein [Segetibacter sp.]